MSSKTPHDFGHSIYRIFHAQVDVLRETFIALAHAEPGSALERDLLDARANAEASACRWAANTEKLHLQADRVFATGSMPLLRALPTPDKRVSVDVPSNGREFLLRTGPEYASLALDRFIFEGDLAAAAGWLVHHDRAWLPLIERITPTPIVLDGAIRCWSGYGVVASLQAKLDHYRNVHVPMLAKQIAADPGIGRGLATIVAEGKQSATATAVKLLRQLQACGASIEDLPAVEALLDPLSNHERMAAHTPCLETLRLARSPIGG